MNFAVPLCLPVHDGPLLRVTCANRRKTGFTPGRAAEPACLHSHQPCSSLDQAWDSVPVPRVSAITEASSALAALGQCLHWLSIVGRCPTSNTGIIARLGAVVKGGFCEGEAKAPLCRGAAAARRLRGSLRNTNLSVCFADTSLEREASLLRRAAKRLPLEGAGSRQAD